MNSKLKYLIASLLVITGTFVSAAPARADLEDALREVGRSIRREVEDRRRDRVREAICRRAEGDFRSICRTVDDIDEVADEIREDVNRHRILEELFDD